MKFTNTLLIRERNIMDNLSNEIEQAMQLEKTVHDAEDKLMLVPEFRDFMLHKKLVDAKLAEFWKQLETKMIETDTKSIKGLWGSVTLAEKLSWHTDDSLPSKFYKKAVDSKELSDTYRLDGKAPKGATPTYTKYLVKRFK